MLKKYRQQYAGNAVQFVLMNTDGVVLESDQQIFNIAVGKSILNFHPFFESLPTLLAGDEKAFKFFCIHLSIGEKKVITDIRLLKEDEGIVLIINDLTEHYSSYQLVAQTRNESIIKTELTVIKNKELEEREKFKNQFIQNFSHEIRNPLTSIMAIANVLSNTDLTNEQREMLDFLKASNTNLKLMLEDILSINMIESGKLRMEEKMFSLVRLGELLEFTYKTKAKQKGLEFKYTIDQKIPEFIEGDRLRLFQVVSNLLDNAIKNTHEGSVTLNIDLNQKWGNKVNIRFCITDTGIGIPEEKIDAIFESFVQINTPGQQQGTGLGLALVKGLLVGMGSEIKVESKCDEGSRFFFDISLKYPLHPLDQLSSEKKDAKISSTFELRNNRKIKVLMVEDDEHVQMMLFKSLSETGSFYIDMADDGAKVMERIIENSYDLILMDVNLPNISGNQLTKIIRDLPFKKSNKIPIIGLTANAYSDNIDECLQSGMNAVLTKPFEHQELLETIFRIVK